MILRWLWLVLVVALWWLIRRLIREARGSPAVTGARSTARPRFEGTMVRDRICNTFLPRSRAVVHREGGEEHYFCSEACRSAFLTQRNPVGS